MDKLDTASIITLENIKKAGEELDRLTPPSTPFLVFSADLWKKYKEFGWTDEDLKRAKHNNGFLGKRRGVNCYLDHCILMPDANVTIHYK